MGLNSLKNAIMKMKYGELDTKNFLSAGFHKVEKQSKEQPFAPFTDDCKFFRIPAITTMKNGNLFAAADARYETTGDGGGLDTMVAFSKDNGKTWEESYAIWYPDSNRYAGKKATTCIDPVVIEDSDGVLYVLADMNPTGVTTMHGYTFPHINTGYMTVNGVERLALTDKYSKVNKNPKDTPYPFYVGDFKNGIADILNYSDNTPTDYACDEWLNLFKKENGKLTPMLQRQVNKPHDTIQQNAFYKASLFHVYNTGYMFLATSRDSGKTWQPKILNPQIKRHNEGALLVSPGKGLLTKDDKIILPFYNWYPKEVGLVQSASFIWSDDKGETWHRTADAPTNSEIKWSSENEIVEIQNGVLRMFIRNDTYKISYIDAKWDDSKNDYVWENPVITDVVTHSPCNVTAITYSKPIDDKMAVMVAAPSGKGRANGKIFTFLLDENNNMELKYVYSVNNGEYAYSCMTELDDGSVGLLYEPKPAEILFESIPLSKVIENKA